MKIRSHGYFYFELQLPNTFNIFMSTILLGSRGDWGGVGHKIYFGLYKTHHQGYQACN